MPGSAGERRDWGRRRARAWCTPTWWAPGRPRHGPAAARALALIDAPPPAYLVGDGPLRGPLTRLIRARGLEAVVHLPGWSYEPARYIAQATVHVVPHAASRASAATNTTGALPARNRPVKASRGDGSPGRGPAGSASRRYRGVDRIFLVQHPDFPAEPALLNVLPAWPLAEAGKAGTASGGRVQGHSAGAARAAGGRLTRLDGAPRHDAAAPGRAGNLNPAGLGFR